MKDLESRLANYLGMLNQIKAGLKIRPQDAVEIPPELRKYRQMKQTGLPLWEGGLQDQPHIWLEMLGVIESVVRTFDDLGRSNRRQE